MPYPKTPEGRVSQARCNARYYAKNKQKVIDQAAAHRRKRMDRGARGH